MQEVSCPPGKSVTDREGPTHGRTRTLVYIEFITINAKAFNNFLFTVTQPTPVAPVTIHISHRRLSDKLSHQTRLPPLHTSSMHLTVHTTVHRKKTSIVLLCSIPAVSVLNFDYYVLDRLYYIHD